MTTLAFMATLSDLIWFRINAVYNNLYKIAAFTVLKSERKISPNGQVQ